MDILLIQPPIRDFYLTAKRTIPYGLACLASSLRHEGYTVEIFDALASSRSRIVPLPAPMAYLPPFYGRPDRSPFALFHHFRHFGYSFETIGKVAAASGAFLVGISSLFSAYSDEALKSVEVVKASLPQCKVVLGGHHPTALPETVMASGAVDYLIRGEGEEAMVKLARALQQGAQGLKDLGSIEGLVYRQSDGTLKINAPAQLSAAALDRLPATELLRHDFYRQQGRGRAVIMASRGCPLPCTYCSVGALSPLSYRRRSIPSVLAEVERAVVEQGAGLIDFEDENLSFDKAWFLSLLEEIRSRWGEHHLCLRAMNGLLPHSLDGKVIGAMQAAGFDVLNLSLGSSCPEQCKRFKRPAQRQAFDRALQEASARGMKAIGYIIVGAPGQLAEDSLADLFFLAERRVLAGVSVYYPAPGSEDYARLAAQDRLPPHLSLLRSTALPLSSTTSREQVVTLLRLGRVLNFIKLLLDQGELLPPAAPLSPLPSKLEDRIGLGRILLQAFFADGILRGITPEGEIIEHQSDGRLCQQFCQGIKRLNVRGS
jgi:radical SAM superfamily enzyme YgiQ (UPF0313 family)